MKIKLLPFNLQSAAFQVCLLLLAGIFFFSHRGFAQCNLPAPSINGPSQICSSAFPKQYIFYSPLAESYSWVVRGGGIIYAQGENNPGEIFIDPMSYSPDPSQSYYYELEVTAHSTCNLNESNPDAPPNYVPVQSQPVVFGFTVVPNAGGALPVISSSPDISTFCPGTVITYSGPSGKTRYQWTISSGGLVTGGSLTGPSVTVSWNSTGSHNIGLRTEESGGCTRNNSKSVTAFNPEMPSLVNSVGSTSFCQNVTVTFTTDAGRSNYSWSYPGAEKISGGASTDNSITLRWNTWGQKNVSVSYRDTYGCNSSIKNESLWVKSRPIPTITNSLNTNTVCRQTRVTYTTEPSKTNYVWNVSAGGTKESGGNGYDYVTVVWNTSGAQSVSVSYIENGCDVITPTVQAINVSTFTNANPNAAITPGGTVAVCAEGSVTFSSPSGSSYQWSNAATTQSIAVNYAGDFWVFVTDANGCVSRSTTVSTTLNPVTPSLSNSSGAGPASICAGTTIIYTTDPGRSNYTWSYAGAEKLSGGGLTDNSITLRWNNPGNQVIGVSFRYSNGCNSLVKNESVTIKARPVPTLSNSLNTNSVCRQTRVTYTTESGQTNYQWIVSAGGTKESGGTASQSFVTVIWNTSGAQSVSVNYTDPNGCDASVPAAQAVNVTSFANANPNPVITAGGPTTFCSGSSVTLTSSSGSSYQWSNAATTPSVVVNTAGNFSVSVTDVNGCVSKTPVVTTVLYPSPNALIIFQGPNGSAPPYVLCQNESASLMVPPTTGASYEWQKDGSVIAGATTTSINVNTQGAYSVKVTGSNGCVSTNGIFVNVFPLPVIVGPSTLIPDSVVLYSSPSVPDHSLTWTISQGGVFDYEEPTSSVTGNSAYVKWTVPVSTQSVSLVQEVLPDKFCYSFMNVSVLKYRQYISFNPLPAKTFGSAPFVLSAWVPSGLPITFSSSNPSVATVSGTTVTIVGAGTTTITASQGGNNNWQPASLSRNLVVNKASQTISFNSLPAKTYGNPSFNLVASASSGLSVSFTSSNPSVATVSGTTVTIVGAGTTTITASQAGNNNWEPAANVSQNLVVSRASQTISFNPLPTKTYGHPPFNLAASASSGLSVSFTSSNPSVAKVLGTTVTIVGAGTTIIKASQAGNANYYAAFVQQNLIVNKANQSIYFGPLPSMVYGNGSYNLTANASSGLPVSFISSNNSVASVTGNTLYIVGAGNATITANQGGNTNYNSATSSQALNVGKATLTVIPNNAYKTYGSSDPGFSFYYSGFIGSDHAGMIDTSPAVSTNAGQCSGPGRYSISTSGGSDNNYQFSYDGAYLDVYKAQLYVFADYKSKTYGEVNPQITYAYTGFVCGNYAIQSPPVASHTASQYSDVGSYPINFIYSGYDPYYEFNLYNGGLTINQAQQTINFPSIPLQCGTGTVYLNAASSSGLPLTFTSSNESVAYIYGSTAEALNFGEAYITAYQNGNGNFAAAPPVTQLLSVPGNSGTIYVDGDLDICNSGYVYLTAGWGHSYTWATPYSYYESQSVMATEPGTYSVTYTDYYTGCTLYASVEVIREGYGYGCVFARSATPKDKKGSHDPIPTVQLHDNTSGDPDVAALSAYPNPANNMVTIAMPLKMENETPVQVYDGFGRPVSQAIIRKGEWKTDVSVKDIPDGLYIVRVGTGPLLNVVKVTVLHHQ